MLLLQKKINQVTIDDLRRVGSKYISKMFSNDAKTIITCHSEKASDIASAFLE